jgi:phosphoesterase RecJ-like protein
MKPEDFQRVNHFFASHQRFLVTSHIRPDGDAVGSVLGLGLALKAAGKTVEMVLPDGAPEIYSFLPGFRQISRKIKSENSVIVSVDASDMGRLGDTFAHSKPALNIDHHITNDNFAELNWVEPAASATAEILADRMPAWGLPITKEVADALTLGIVTDTLGFKTSNVTPKTMRVTADLMNIGANLQEIYARGLDARSAQAVQLWRYGLTNLQNEGELVWTTLTLKDRKAAGYPGRDDADLINVLSSINNAKIAVIFVEQSDSKTKVSWRAKPDYDVSKVAAVFGGGGHKAASGAEVGGSLETIIQKVLEETKSLLQ